MEPTLAMTLTDYEDRLRFESGYGSGALENEIVKRSWQSGLRQFYTPPLVGGVSHNWSFLKPVGTLLVPSGDQLTAMPADFGGFEGPLHVLDSQQTYPEVILRADLMRRYADRPSATGRPQFAEVIPVKETTAKSGQRHQLWVWPQPDADYTLRFRYYFHASALTGDRPYAYGGPEHAETVAASCLAAFEDMADRPDGPREQWPRWSRFMERLAASISADRRMRPNELGYNADFPPWRGGRRWGRDWTANEGIITVNGVTPE